MISGFLTQLKNKYEDKLDEKAAQYIRFAVDGANRMHHIIIDLLEYSKAGKMDETVEPVDLNKLIAGVERLCINQINEKHAAIVVDEMPVLKLPFTLIEQIFINLLNNALKYTSLTESPKIFVTANDADTHWHFTVKDNGIGIEKDYFEKIFIIFQRLHRKNEYSGTGIGLAITKKIVEYLGGTIWVESELEKGSKFHFTILKIS